MYTSIRPKLKAIETDKKSRIKSEVQQSIATVFQSSLATRNAGFLKTQVFQKSIFSEKKARENDELGKNEEN